MKKIRKIDRITLLLATIFAVSLSSCKENLYFEKPNYDAPVVEQISPATASKYSEITVTGKNLNKVSKIFIGGEEVELKQRITNEKLIFVANGATSGKVAVEAYINSQKVEVESDQLFTYRFDPPQIKLIPSAIEVGSVVIFKGENLLAIEELYIVDASAASSSEKVMATIMTKLADEILIRVPFSNFAAVKVVAKYYDGVADIETAPFGEGSQLVVIPPVVSSVSGNTIEENGELAIEGSYLDKVSSVWLGGKQIGIASQSANRLVVRLQTDLFEDGVTENQELRINYFEDVAHTIVNTTTTVKVSTIFIGRGQVINGRDRTMGVFKSFYSLQMGQAMDNGAFSVAIDSISFKNSGGAWSDTPMSAANVINKEKITKQMYDAVAPYLYIQTTSGGNIQLNGPGNSTGVYRNLYSTASGGVNILGAKDLVGCGTPLVMLLPIFPASKDAAFVAAKPDIDRAVAAVRGGTLDVINSTNFPVNITNSTVGGIPLTLADGKTALSGGPNYTLWSSGVGPGQANMNLQASNNDGVIMVVYYDYDKGYDPLKPAEGIQKIGFVHVTGLEAASASGTELLKSKIQMDSYFQKRAYSPVQ